MGKHRLGKHGNGHLGGHAWVTHLDTGCLNYMINQFNIKTMVDIGCGPGGQVELAQSLGLIAEGVDGDDRVLQLNPEIIICDFTKDVYAVKTYDLGWSCEFLEHVEEQYQPNYMKTFQCCKYVIATFAPRGKPGYHHVNCQSAGYWIDVFERYGFLFDPSITNTIRSSSTMQRNFVREHGLFFTNQNYMECT